MHVGSRCTSWFDFGWKRGQGEAHACRIERATSGFHFVWFAVYYLAIDLNVQWRWIIEQTEEERSGVDKCVMHGDLTARTG